MSADVLLARLAGLRETGQGRWIARCPAHEDRSPSLSLRLGDSGKLLVRCMAGCETEAVLDAVGLNFSALFADRPTVHRVRPSRSSVPAGDLLLMVEEDVLAFSIGAGQLMDARQLSEADWQHMAGAARRIGWAAGEIRKAHPWRPRNGR